MRFPMPLRVALGGLAILLVASPALAQSLLHETFGPQDGARLGTSVDGLDDVDGDGHADVLVGAYLADGVGAESGEVRVISGADGSTLYTLGGDAAGDWFGYSVSCLGFVDFDNRRDFVVGAPHGGYARVFSGADGSELTTIAGAFNSSYCVSDVGDVNADGRDDIGVGTWDDSSVGTNNGVFRIYSGLDWSLMIEVFGNPWQRLGTSMTGLGDVDGDLHDDFAVGAIGLDGGLVQVFSGIDFSLMYELQGDEPGDMLGYSLAGGMDLDWDTLPDLVAGAPGHDAWAGYARAYSGLTGAEIFTNYGEPSSSNGSSVGLMRVFVGDDQTYVLVGAETADRDDHGILTQNAGRVRLLHGTTGDEAFVFEGREAAATFGASVAAAGDVDGDGFEDLVAGAPTTIVGGEAPGAAHVLSPQLRGSWSSTCAPLPNSAGGGANLSAQGSASVFVNDLMLHATGLPPSVTVLAFYGPQEIAAPFGDGTLCVGAPQYRYAPVWTSGGSGLLTRHFDLTRQPAASGPGRVDGGESWHVQLWYRDVANGGAGFNTSSGLQVDFLP